MQSGLREQFSDLIDQLNTTRQSSLLLHMGVRRYLLQPFLVYRKAHWLAGARKTQRRYATAFACLTMLSPLFVLPYEYKMIYVATVGGLLSLLVMYETIKTVRRL